VKQTDGSESGLGPFSEGSSESDIAVGAAWEWVTAAHCHCNLGSAIQGDRICRTSVVIVQQVIRDYGCYSGILGCDTSSKIMVLDGVWTDQAAEPRKGPSSHRFGIRRFGGWIIGKYPCGTVGSGDHVNTGWSRVGWKCMRGVGQHKDRLLDMGKRRQGCMVK
jgi:hypothetical protein